MIKIKTKVLLLLAALLLAPRPATAQEEARTIKAIVALCDNANQGIVPVPAALGRGDDPRNNLYWGAMYGVKARFRRNPDWTLFQSDEDRTTPVMERLQFKHKTANVILTAEAWRGDQMKEALTEFLKTASDKSADLVVFVGHNGLMEIPAPPIPAPKPGKSQAIVLACSSQPYFEPLLKKAGVDPLLLTTGFMAPEAYTLEAALEGWVAGEPAGRIHERAARAYHKYQQCGLKGASRLFVSP